MESLELQCWSLEGQSGGGKLRRALSFIEVLLLLLLPLLTINPGEIDSFVFVKEGF